MTNQEKIFLPMEEQVIDCINSFMDIELVIVLFEYYKYRDGKESGNKNTEAFNKRFERLVQKERELRYHLDRMHRELDLMFENTPPSFHKKIQSQIKYDIEQLEVLISKNQVINILKTNNLYKPHKFWDQSGEIMETPLRRSEHEILDLSLLTTEYFGEYLELLNKFVIFFKFEATLFLEKGEPIEADEEYPDFPLFSDTSVRDFILDWQRFIKVCEYYKEERKFSVEETYKVISYDKDGTQYIWNGIGQSNKVETLAQFIRKLFTENIISLPLKAPVSRVFLRFFGNMKNDENAVKDLSKEIDNKGSVYRNYFAEIKNITI